MRLQMTKKNLKTFHFLLQPFFHKLSNSHVSAVIKSEQFCNIAKAHYDICILVSIYFKFGKLS